MVRLPGLAARVVRLRDDGARARRRRAAAVPGRRQEHQTMIRIVNTAMWWANEAFAHPQEESRTVADTAKPSHPRDASEVKRWQREADVVVVGAGGAGVCTALEARAAGADVLVLERAGRAAERRRRRPGRSTWAAARRSRRPAASKTSRGDGPVPDRGARARAPRPEDPCLLRAQRRALPLAHGPRHSVQAELSAGRGRPRPRPTTASSTSGSEVGRPFREIARPAPRAHTASRSARTPAACSWSSCAVSARRPARGC